MFSSGSIWRPLVNQTKFYNDYQEDCNKKAQVDVGDKTFWIQQAKEGHERQLKNAKREEQNQELIRTYAEVLVKEREMKKSKMEVDADEDSSDVDFSRSRLSTLRNTMIQLI
ncbi:hypothetical protein K501DRAFT_267265 [Backusella circina FSU 941]|nr:hypothetical protein K501DRAFT_267265 [Backusella circina FSU 941]